MDYTIFKIIYIYFYQYKKQSENRSCQCPENTLKGIADSILIMGLDTPEYGQRRIERCSLSAAKQVYHET